MRRERFVLFPLSCLAIALGCVALIAAGWAVTLERIGYERDGTVEESVRHNGNLALAFEEHTIRTIGGLDRVVRLIGHHYLERGAALNRQFLAEEGGLDLSELTSAVVIDERGDIALSLKENGISGASVVEREYFQYHRDYPDKELRVGEPTIERPAGRPSIHLTRRIERRDGTFAGVAVVGVAPEHFAGFYDDVDLGMRGMILLVGLDGRIRAHRSGLKLSAGEDLGGSPLFTGLAGRPSGSYLASGSPDGVERYVSYRRVREFPLIVAVGTARDEVLAPFAGRRHNYLIGASLATVFILVSGGALLLALRRRQLALGAMLESQVQFRQLAENIREVFWLTDPGKNQMLYISPGYEQIWGRSCESLYAAPRAWIEAIHPDDREHVLHAAQTRQATGEYAEEYRIVRPDGAIRWIRDRAFPVRRGAQVYRIAGLAEDITEHKQAQERLLRQAHFDALTELPNRVLCFDRLAQALAQASRKHWNAGVLFVDLDRFKIVNDTLGHAAGDALLREAGQRLRGCVRAGDTVARVGGDEFVVVLAELARPQDAAVVAQKMIDAMATPVHVEDREIFVTASIGIASYPWDGTDAEMLVKNADAAMFRAKDLGRNNFQFYTAALNERAMEKLLLETDLRRALEREEFLLHYQPKVHLGSGRVTGVEALLRWRRPGNGLVSPAQFVPVLEDSGLIVPVGDWIIEAVCAQIRAWRNGGAGAIPVAVNLSAKQFLHHDIGAVIEDALRRHGIDAAFLEIEITESDAMANPAQAAQMLERLKQRGVRVAIDDFGTGYSSLGYLKRFPLDTLKIDRSFVTGLPGDADDASIARAVIGMAHSLGLRVVAEGVEKADQREFLTAHDCDEMQGYLFSRPLPAAECGAFLKSDLEAIRRRARATG